MRKLLLGFALAAAVAVGLGSHGARAQTISGYQIIPSTFPLVLPTSVPTPTALFRFNDQSGSPFNDSAGPYTGTYQGSPTYNVNPVSPNEMSSVKFGTTNGARTAAGTPGQLAADFTVAVFVASTTTAITQRVICFGTPSSSYSGWCVGSDATTPTTLTTQIPNSASTYVKEQLANGYPASGVATMIAVTYSNAAGNWNTYSYNGGAMLNNNSQTTVPLQLSPAPPAYLEFGASAANSNGCQCSLGDAFLWNSVLTSAQLLAVAQAGLVKGQ